MAKKRDQKSRGDAGMGGAAAAGRGLRRHLRQLEKMLTVAASKESRRVRKLEKVHVKRQRIEAEIETARLAASLAPAASVKAPKAPPVSSTGEPTQKVPAKAAAAKTPARASANAPIKAASAKAPAKATAAKTALAKTPARAVRAKAPVKTPARAVRAKAPAKTPARAVLAKAPAKTPATTPPATLPESRTEP